jgi:restriction system protein
LPVPDFQTLFRPVLEALEDGRDHGVKDIRERLTTVFSLSQDDLGELIPSGRVTMFQNRVGWALTYLYRTRLIDRPARAVYRINDRGRQVVAENPGRIDLKVLAQFEEFAEFRQAKEGFDRRDDDAAAAATSDDQQTPEERIDSAYRELRAALAGELLDHIFEQSAEFFEQLVLDVLHSMGYGGGQEDAAERLGKSGDGGVDGVIREDRLGLDLIYVQAKRWQDVVGRPEIQKFFGALHGQKATKGIFITTSAFSREASAYAESVTPRVILIEGKELAQLMIDYDVGVTASHRYALKRLDLDYFASEEWAASGSAGGGPGPLSATDRSALPDLGSVDLSSISGDSP